MDSQTHLQIENSLDQLKYLFEKGSYLKRLSPENSPKNKLLVSPKFTRDLDSPSSGQLEESSAQADSVQKKAGENFFSKSFTSTLARMSRGDFFSPQK